MNQPDLPALQLAESPSSRSPGRPKNDLAPAGGDSEFFPESGAQLSSVEDIPLPDAKPYAAWGIAGGVPLVGIAIGSALLGLPDIVAYLFGLAGLGGVIGGVIAAGRQDEQRTTIARAAIATLPPEVLAHATLDHGLSEKTRILIANYLNDAAPGWHTRIDSEHEDWQTLKAAGANVSACFRSCGGGCGPKR